MMLWPDYCFEFRFDSWEASMQLQGEPRTSGDRRPGLAMNRIARGWMWIMAGVGLLVLGVTAPAYADQLVQDHYSVSDTEMVQICGRTFQHDFAYDGTFSFVFRGTSPAPYGADRTHTVDVYTNPATGKTFTNEFRGQFRDFTISIDDQTNVLTLTAMKSGTVTAYDTHGTLLFRDAGTFLETVLLDDGGTPGLPDDDTFIADLGTTFGPHGRTDTYSRDFCTDLVAVTS
jgi:hypothetical protein